LDTAERYELQARELSSLAEELTVYPEHGSSAGELFNHAELSVYDAEIYGTGPATAGNSGTTA
jgi:hypothetical protein